MSDVLLLVGCGLCLLSVILAVIGVLAMRPPRGAAIALVMGLAALAGAAWLSPEPLSPASIQPAWERLSAGEFRM